MIDQKARELIVTQKSLVFDPGSYRDRNGRVLVCADRVFRVLSTRARSEWVALSESKLFVRAVSERQIVTTRPVPLSEIERISAIDLGGWESALEHDRLPLISYPFEWTFGMLRDAALLTLELLASALEENLTLKDGTAYNIQFRGTHPVLIDVASFEQWEPGSPWTGYRQFCQTFLFPLFLQAYKGVDFQSFLRGRLDGILPEEMNQLTSWRDLLRPGVFVHSYLHSRFQKSQKVEQSNVKQSFANSGAKIAMVKNTVRSLTKLVKSLNWSAGPSTWSDYTPNYQPADWDAKKAFVRRCVESSRPNVVWDLGCNTGTFSRIAAEFAPVVVALDGDHLAVEKLYQELRQEGTSEAAARITPLVGNLVDPAPSMGWRLKERRSLEERCPPDVVLALALIHHVVLSAGVPLVEFLDWLAALNCRVVLEFVDVADPQAQRLLRNRRNDETDYSVEKCEEGLKTRFAHVERQTLEVGTRTLFFAEPHTH